MIRFRKVVLPLPKKPEIIWNGIFDILRINISPHKLKNEFSNKEFGYQIQLKNLKYRIRNKE